MGSAMGQCVTAEFPGLGMREICWPGRNAAVTKQLGWASQWRWFHACATWGHPCVSLQTLSAVFCQPCQGCLMCLSLVQVCARLGPPASSGNVFFFCSGHICLPSAGQGPAQLPAGVPVCHACVTTAPPASVPGSLPATSPSSPHTGRPPTPLAPFPLPHSASTKTLDFQRQLCHENVFTVGCWGAVYPQEHSGGILCSRESQRRSEKCQGCTAWHDSSHPVAWTVQPHPLRHRALPGTSVSTAALGLGVPFPVAQGGRRPGSFPRGRAHITSSGSDGAAGGEAPLPACPPPALPPAAAAPAQRGPRIPGLFLGWPYQPSCPCCRLPPH